jgi:hypothetical protein
MWVSWDMSEHYPKDNPTAGETKVRPRTGPYDRHQVPPVTGIMRRKKSAAAGHIDILVPNHT